MTSSPWSPSAAIGFDLFPGPLVEIAQDAIPVLIGPPLF